MIAKCANPACPVRFDHRLGGKFFRFLHHQSSTVAALNGFHNVQHFWLCARCSQVSTLVYVEGCGVVVEFLPPEVPAETAQEQLATA